jgi:hypothetical protein
MIQNWGRGAGSVLLAETCIRQFMWLGLDVVTDRWKNGEVCYGYSYKNMYMYMCNGVQSMIMLFSRVFFS